MNKIDLEKKLNTLYEINESLRDKYNGLYYASVSDKYKYTWIRDTYYQVKPQLKKDKRKYIQTYRSILDYFKRINYKYENKIDNLIKKPYPINNIRCIHPRFYTETMDEITGDWGNQQDDIIGYFFLGIAEGIKQGLDIIRDESDIDIINKLINVLYKIKYWTHHANGIWEEESTIQSSSIGAIVSGLKALEEVDFIIPQKLITEGQKVLTCLLPSESITKNVDLSLLTLIYPFNIIDETNKELILKNVHELLEKERGVIRYIGDKYYNVNGEAEWTFGFAYLFFSYVDTDFELAEKYLEKLLLLIDENGFVPELYFSNTDKPNDNNPLGWSVAMTILTIEKYIQLKFKN